MKLTALRNIFTAFISLLPLATLAWDGVTATPFPAGSGTEDDPYQIWTAENLYYLSQNPDLWSYGHYFVQKDDIDLSGKLFPGIGYGTDGSYTDECNATAHKPFGATYDGHGCMIRNLHLNWGNPSDATKRATGLFGFLTGTVRNLHIDQAVVTRDEGSKVNYGQDIKVAVLAGAVTPDRNNTKEVNIENIIITRSRIDDGGEDPRYRSYYMGGVVGDITSGFGAYNAISSTYRGYVNIRNVYVDVDFDMRHAINRSSVQDSHKMQFDVGGIVGRMRRGKYSDLPTSCFYRGQVHAQMGIINPVIAHSRCNGSADLTNTTNAYAWEVIYPDNQSANSSASFIVLGAATAEINDELVTLANDRLFGDYKIYDNATGQYEEITDTYPLAVSSRYNIRVLDQGSSSEVKFIYNDSTAMRAFQGLSHGTYANPNTADGRATILNMLAGNNDDSSVVFGWSADNSYMRFVMTPTVSLSRSRLHTFDATIDNYRSSNDYTFRWTVTLADGTTQTVTHSTSTPDRTESRYTLSLDKDKCSIVLPSDVNDYQSIQFELIDSEGNVVDTQSINVEPVTVTIERTIAVNTSTTLNDHYVFYPEFTIGGTTYSLDDPMLEDITCQWQTVVNGVAADLAGSAYEADATGTDINDGDPRKAHVVNTFVGTIRLAVYDTQMGNTPGYLLYSNGLEYVDQVVKQLHLQVAMYEYNPSTKKYEEFKASDYFSTKAGYDVTYTYDESNTSGIKVIDSGGNTHYLAASNTHGTINDTSVKPLIFRAQVVDQYGNDWLDEENRDKWRIEWTYRIPGDGASDDRKSANFVANPDYDSSDITSPRGWNTINGQYSPLPSGYDESVSGKYNYGLEDETSGYQIDWVGAYYRPDGSSDKNFLIDRYGCYQVDSVGTRLIIHPNILHRTSAFWVRARLYNVVGDPEGEIPGETIVTFNQLAVDFDRNTDADGNVTSYLAKVVWRGVDPDVADNLYTSSSTCTYTWEATDDPTDYNSWTPVATHYGSGSGTRTDELTGVNPQKYYRFTFSTSSGTVLSDIIGPVNVIYLYDRAQTMSNSVLHNFSPYSTQTNQYYPAGLDINTGHDPWNAVRTIDRAYELLTSYADGGRPSTNMIVIMGYYKNNSYLESSTRTAGKYSKPTTLAGANGAYISGGTWGRGEDNKGKWDITLQAPLKMEKLDLYDHGAATGGNYNCLYMYNHDFEVGSGVRMRHFQHIGQSGNAASAGLDKDALAPNFTLVFGRYNDDNDMTNPDNDITYTWNAVPGVTTVKLYSGNYGRIICGSRNDKNGTDLTKSRHVFGSPWAPCRSRLTVDLEDTDGYTSTWENLAVNTQIGLIVGGQTDGSVYADVVADIYNGQVGRFAAGNIAYGHAVPNGPTDSFFGSTVLNIHGGSIDQLYGGCIGRCDGEGTSLDAYMYGRSIINLYNGTIGKSGSAYSLYTGGAGCVTGIGHDWDYNRKYSDEKSYTPDKFIPYYSNGSLVYGDYTAAAGSVPTMVIYDTDGRATDDDGNDVSTTLDLADTYVEANLYGGTVNGSVYGGGFGYSNSLTSYEKAAFRTLSDGTKIGLAGNLYGNAYIRLLPNPSGASPVVVTGSIYGGGSGEKAYADAAASGYDFTRVAQIFGNVQVDIEDGTVERDVYAAGMGVEEYPEMGIIYGDCTLTISGGTVGGNIYGGGRFSDLRKYSLAGTTDELGGNTQVTISNGSIGNCVFGGGLGSDGTSANVEGNATVNIFGGQFSKTIEGVNPITGQIETKNFNIYGGAYHNGYVGGNTQVNITASPLTYTESLGDNAVFTDLWNDITVRRFCVYGGGYGEKTLVKGNAKLSINITEESLNHSITEPSLDDITSIAVGQTFFDVAGGGYSGDVGYWANSSGTAVSSLSSPTLADYDHYVGGHIDIEIQGSPIIRKVIGGGFYAQCNKTEMFVREGQVKEIYGGALMGYVHDNGRMHIGNRSVAVTDSAEVAAKNARLFVTGNIYGGNDVKGIVGTCKWADKFPEELEFCNGVETTDGGPLFCADVSDVDEKGVTMSLNGGTVKGNVYGAGNGHYRGYYVPGWARYGDGPDRQYRKALLPGKTPGSTNESDYGRVYRCRPMVGKVSMHIGGNSSTDRMTIMGDVFGGGRSCTVGQWNTALPFEDPRRLSRGGFLHVNVGSHVTVGGSLYMGSEGDGFDENHTVPKGLSLATFDGSTTAELDKMGDVAYDHWYFNKKLGYYVPGYPAPGETDGNFDMLGQHMLRSYVKNIEMNGDVELTFYNMPFETEVYEDGNPLYVVRKRWLPGELALYAYDAEDVILGNFFGGGSCGSMTNNNVMWWDYDTKGPVDDPSKAIDPEKKGSIYRYCLPEGITVLDRIVGGSEMATNRVYAFSDDYTTMDRTADNLYYTFEGGMVTHASYDYYLIVYNDLYGLDKNDVSWTTFMNSDAKNYSTSYTLTQGTDAGTTIYPRLYNASLLTFPNATNLNNARYALAYTKDADGNIHAYCGPRESRDGYNVMKLTAKCKFDPQEGEYDYEGEVENPSEHFVHYGGVVYGGCYESGVTQGDVVVTVLSNTIGEHLSERDPETFEDISSLQHNIGRVFGGGYGEDSRVDGDTYVNLLNNFVGMNVFGGGCQGSVNGQTHVKYMGNESTSYVFGAIYGGGLMGSVGIPTGSDEATPVATKVQLYSGNVDKAYGGSCLGNLYGRTHVELCDQVYDDDTFQSFNYSQFKYDWGGSRLIAGTVFGGNDISGNITVQPLDANDPDYDWRDEYSTYIYVHEVQGEPANSTSSRKRNAVVEESEDNPGKDTPGASDGYNGFPLVGNLYAGSNGNYGKHEGEEYYTDGSFLLASGLANHTNEYLLAGDTKEGYSAFAVPHVDNSYLDIQGGTMINVYGGGDMSTIINETNINVNYDPKEAIMDARAGFQGTEALLRVWNTFHLSDQEQIEEVTSTSLADGDEDVIFKYHIYRLFGGNDQADMDIQPTWNLRSGHLGSVYSGGNFGKMTYFDSTTGKGLSLKIDRSDFHADAVFGGGRVGDIEPKLVDELGNEVTVGDDFYGATLEINRGVIDNVYGGNDVSGNVYNGSRVKISGAISGNVYCAGNGNYRYQYDASLDPEKYSIEERYDSIYGGRYFVLPRKADFGGQSPSDAQKLEAINAYRPNVDRSYLSIEGTDADTKAFVRGYVYCGGNSSTVSDKNNSAVTSDIKFQIGNYVVLNGVFLGSNGESLVDVDMMEVTEALNGLSLADTNYESNRADYPYLLDLYMRAVETTALPKNASDDTFNLTSGLTDAYIGDFFVGGNSGSMLTDKTIDLTFPYQLVIFNRIVGGSNSANVTYKGVTHVGGLTKTLASGYTDKVYLQVRSQFRPMRILYPVDNDYRKIALVPDLDVINGNIYFPEGKCSIFGGCFNSGRTVGNVHIDLYSDLTKEYDEDTLEEDIKLIKTYFKDELGSFDLTSLEYSKERIIVNGIDNLQRRSFALIGGGYGKDTEVRGDIRLHMLPGQLHPDWTVETKAGLEPDDSPSAATVFGGSQQGLVVGNTEIAVRDGMVLSNLYGGSEASTLYGSTQIIVGWPQYYLCKKSGHFKLRRTDELSSAAKENWKHSEITSKEAILRDIWLREGEYMSVNLFNQLDPTNQPYLTGFTAQTAGQTLQDTFADYFKFVDNDTPQEYAHNNTQTTFNPITWDDIKIYIGNGKSRRDSRDEYFAHGNIYGGGFITSTSSASLAGQFTVQKFRDKLPDYKDYGGNSSIIIWDNIENRNPLNTTTAEYNENDFEGTEKATNPGSGAEIKDHITIGTGHYVPVTISVGQDIMGRYIFQQDSNGKYTIEDASGNFVVGNYVHQSSHVLTAADVAQGGDYYGVTFYEIESDGGIYGGGRKVYVEGFRNCDLAYYGYADYSPQYPKLLNTAQRLDLFSVTDCCLFLEGANDFTTNSIDATNYSLTRIGELAMHSSIPATSVLSPGTREQSGLYNTLHTTSRTRNYVGFFHDVLYVAALTSSESFDQAFRGANGQFYSMSDYGYDNDDTHVNTDNTDTSGYDYVGLPSSGFTYREYKKNRIENYYANRDLSNDQYQAIKNLTSLEFDQRNIGTAANMIGINNGYTLKIQGAGKNADGEDDTYFGPVNGVFEIKLMTLAMDEGGGYIYALNHHEDPNHFLESTGNFVFPGAAYKVTDNNNGNYNYVYDDCFPMGEGWDSYYNWTGSSSSMGPRTQAVDAGHGDCNDLQEVHYWYVNGSNYYYNVTLTAYTYTDPLPFTLNNNDNLIYLYGVQDGSELTLESVNWEQVTTDGYSSDLQNISTLVTDAEGNPDHYEKDYRLYLTVDNTPSTAHSTSANGYSVMIPRGNLTDTNAGSADAVANASTASNPYHNTEASPNKPLLGISLFDNMDNADPAYYYAHLQEPEKVRLSLTTTTGTSEFHYVINLTIRYLLGPTITGNAVIENCALPGELIYANASNVEVEMDEETMAVAGAYWQLKSPDGDTVKLVDTNDGAVAGATTAQVQFPAYWYQNGWDLQYVMTINGLDFTKGTADDATYPNVEVHNYHRMLATDGTRKFDLLPVEGARIYVEDLADLNRFVSYLSEVNATGYEGVTLKGTDLKANPKSAEGLKFYLVNDMTVDELTVDANAEFKGQWHGDGHTLTLPDGSPLLAKNSGKVYNTGFVMKGKGSYTQGAVNTATGATENCFFYDPSNPSTPEDFRYGKIAYNVNGEYLKARYVALGGTEHDVDSEGNVTDGFQGRDAWVTTYLDDYYGNGDYRFAAYGGTAEALRTHDLPNFLNYRSLVRGEASTAHNYTLERKPEEASRYVDKDVVEGRDAHFEPKFPVDYLFFGQTIDLAGTQLYPSLYRGDNRVYRASGFLGSKVDQGFHFNVDAVAADPRLTAIDFSDFRDYGTGSKMVPSRKWVTDDGRDIYYAPSRDLPESTINGIASLEIDSNNQTDEHDRVTRNLLVYTDTVTSWLAPLAYTEQTLENDIQGHLIVKSATDWTFAATDDQLHLVDRQPFNAPKEFGVARRAWYERVPAAYSEGNSGWEGLCLPFAVNRVMAYDNSGRDNDVRSHGELTHFYGSSEILHEYWLRSVAGYESGKGLYFCRPGHAKSLIGTIDGLSEMTGDYDYANPWFTYAYSSRGYVEKHNMYTSTGVKHEGYRFITSRVPYLISFPGSRYYEFDLSGEIFQQRRGEPEPFDQKIVYEYLSDTHRPYSNVLSTALDLTASSDVAAAAKTALTVQVTDDNPAATISTTDGYSLHGTYTYEEIASARSYMINDDYDASGKMRTEFVWGSTGDYVAPFRVYVTTPTSVSSPIKILALGDDTVPEGDGDDIDDLAASGLRFSVTSDGALRIESSQELTLPLYDMTGRLIRQLTVHAGTNLYRGLSAGNYLVSTFKFHIP
ncbi:MAG: hypothetical protein LIP02_11945 [Bacteroidales bacterium]|nr:hypothetical protein [Bacteroidales bacterium]